MADAENAAFSSKKRTAVSQISKDTPEFDDDTPEPEMGSFQRASEEVLATRRIVKIRRQPTASASSNPFAGIRLVTPVDSTTKKDSQVDSQNPSGEAALEESNRSIDNEKREENEIETGIMSDKADETDKANGAETSNIFSEVKVTKDGEEAEPEKVGTEEAGEESEEAGENKLNEAPTVASPFSSFGQLSSSQNAFTSLSGTGFATSSFSFSFASSNNGTASSPLFSKSGGIQTNLQAVPVETGEENEKAIFTADATLYEYLDGSWKERGRGEIKVNTSLSGEKARLVMRTRGNYRLILNAGLYPDMTLADMEKKGITFSCINTAAEERAGLTTCALKFRDASFVEDFRSIVEEHKGAKAIVALKTPENSPKGFDE